MAAVKTHTHSRKVHLDFSGWRGTNYVCAAAWNCCWPITERSWRVITQRAVGRCSFERARLQERTVARRAWNVHTFMYTFRVYEVDLQRHKSYLILIRSGLLAPVHKNKLIKKHICILNIWVLLAEY